MATIIRTHSEEEAELVDLFCKCLEEISRRRRTPYAKAVLKKALELFAGNNLYSVVERDPDSRIHWLQLARVRDLPTIPFVDNGPRGKINIISPLESGGVQSFLEMLALTEEELLGSRFHGFGKAHLRQLKEVLARSSFRLGQKIRGLETEPWPEDE